MKEERISNYVKLCEEWAQRFLKMDQADLHKRVPELKEENGFLYDHSFRKKIWGESGRRQYPEPGWTERTGYYGDAEYLYASGVCERGGFYYG